MAAAPPPFYPCQTSPIWEASEGQRGPPASVAAGTVGGDFPGWLRQMPPCTVANSVHAEHSYKRSRRSSSGCRSTRRPGTGRLTPRSEFITSRGLPMIGALGPLRLPYPSRSFDMVHCVDCHVSWTAHAAGLATATGKGGNGRKDGGGRACNCSCNMEGAGCGAEVQKQHHRRQKSSHPVRF